MGYFVAFLFWTNETNVPGILNLEQEIKQLRIKPINISERLDFIMSKPDNYHSFVQLCQLFEEFTKQYYKSLLLMKKNP